MGLERLKKELLQSAREFYYRHICATYPIYRQLNIANGIEGGIEEMKTFISSARDEEHALESVITSLADCTIKSEFVASAFASNNDMHAFIVSKLPGLTTETQKLAVAVALQTI